MEESRLEKREEELSRLEEIYADRVEELEGLEQSTQGR